jgi:adenylate cyclase
MAEQGIAEPPGWVGTYEAGLAAYTRREWASAIELFREVIAARGEDRPSELFLERCRSYLACPPPEHWTGVSSLSEK